MGKGLVLVRAGPHGNVIRVLVPINTPLEIVNEGLDMLESALDEAVRNPAGPASG